MSLTISQWGYGSGSAVKYVINDKINSATSQFAISELHKALDNVKSSLAEQEAYIIQIAVDKTNLGEQEFQIRTNGSAISVTGGGNLGAMYGVLELAEQIKLSGIKGVSDTEQKPFIEKRGIKFNIPLDARLPSYDDTGDAAQKNIEEMWNPEFWHEFLDQMAINRYNVLTLWTKHPFPALIKLNEYPDVAMDDVYVYNKPITPETEKDWNGIDIQDPANLKLVKKITIDEKIAFWQHVMQYAHDRGIAIYFFTWNAFVTGAEKYGINTNNETGVSYIRECVKAFVETYPYVSGIGVTAGERMSYRIAGRSKEQWLYDTYGLGVQDAVAKNPDRKVDFIFRSHSTFLESIVNDFSSKYPFPVETDYKYSMARMYSSTKPNFFGSEFEPETKRYNIRSWMNVRNDDIFCFRWGNPDYAREYMQNMGAYDIAGFFMGSDGYVWGREFTSKNPALAGELEVKKHWYREMMWGRLAYNPQLDKSFFIRVLGNHFPGSNAEALYELWLKASNIIPALQSLHFKPGDSQWHVEGCVGMYDFAPTEDSGKSAGTSSNDGTTEAGDPGVMYAFATIKDFIDCPVIIPHEMMNIPEYANSLMTGIADPRITPIEIADSLLNLSKKCLEATSDLRIPNSNAAEFLETIADIEAMAQLGAYYAWKIKGAVAFYLYESSADQVKKEVYKKSALEYLETARKSFNQYATNAGARYKTQLLARTTYLDWEQISKDTQKDIDIVLVSKGEKIRVVKLLVDNKRYVNSMEYNQLKDKITGAGCMPQIIPFNQIDSYADFYTRIVVFSEADNDKQIKRMQKEGAEIPAEYSATGYAIVKHNNIYWIMGKNRENMLKAIDEFIRTVNI